MRQDISDFTAERKIPYLLHFTRADNLESIMLNGLAPRSQIDCGSISGLSNDMVRLDGRRGFNCLSISFPNSPMFYKFQQDHPGHEWIILVIHPAVMSHQNTLFCWTNAASNQISQSPDSLLNSVNSFRGLFENRDGHVTREDQFLKSCDPTNVQAEIMVEGVIPPEAIYFVIFPSVPCQTQNLNIIGNRKSLVSSRRGYYGTREYYRKWGHGK